MSRLFSCIGLYVVLSLFLGTISSAWALPAQMTAPATQSQVDSSTSSSIWLTNYQSALQQARRENKALLLFFTGSDWCPTCTKLQKELLENPRVLDSLTPFYIYVRLDYPHASNLISPQEAAQNAALKIQYNITQFPTVVMIDAQEHVMAKTSY